MNQRMKTLGFIGIGAAAAGVYLEATRDRAPVPAPDASPSATASSSASAAGSVPTAPAPSSPVALPTLSLAELDQGVKRLQEAVQAGASADDDPWALAHGLIALGKDLKTDKGRSAIVAIAAFAEPSKGSNPIRYRFPATRAGVRVEPHPHLFTKTLVEIGISLDAPLLAADSQSITLGRLVRDALETASMPSSDHDWRDAAWLLSLMAQTRDQQLSRGVELAPLARAALEHLATQNRPIASFAGPSISAFQPGSPIYAAKKSKSHIYGHHCGGLHFAQAALAGAQLAKSGLETQISAQLDLLLRRYEIERPNYERFSRALGSGEQGLLVRVQRLKFYGHLAETLGLARELGAYDPGSESGRRYDRALRGAAADIVATLGELDRLGAYEKLTSIRAQRDQTYLDLIGDGCHAVRGLRRARPAVAAGGSSP